MSQRTSSLQESRAQRNILRLANVVYSSCALSMTKNREGRGNGDILNLSIMSLIVRDARRLQSVLSKYSECPYFRGFNHRISTQSHSFSSYRVPVVRRRLVQRN